MEVSKLFPRKAVSQPLYNSTMLNPCQSDLITKNNCQFDIKLCQPMFLVECIPVIKIQTHYV